VVAGMSLWVKEHGHQQRRSGTEEHGGPSGILRGARFELGRPVLYARALAGVRAERGRLESPEDVGWQYIGDYTSQSLSRLQ